LEALAVAGVSPPVHSFEGLVFDFALAALFLYPVIRRNRGISSHGREEL
jgi:hypothetical protein